MIGGLQGEFGDLDIKYLKQKSQNVGRKYLEAQEKFRCTVQNGCEIFAAKGQYFRSPRLISQPCKNLPSTWSDLLAMAVTPSFQL